MNLIRKIKRTYLMLPILLVGILFNNSCTKIDTLPILELRILSLKGQPVAGVMVGLFDELEEWSMRENPIQVWKETGLDGKVRFVDLEEEIYYFFADGDSISNIGHEIKLLEPLRINEIRRITVILE